MLCIIEAVIAQGPILGGDPGPALLPTAPVHSDPGSPAGIWTRTSPPVTASVLPLDYGALEPIRGRVFQLGARTRPLLNHRERA